MQRALFIGRFQPFHNAHLEDIRRILREADEVLIAVGSSNEKDTLENPFSYSERKNMIINVLRNNKIKNFKIFPVPDLYDDQKWVDYILKNLPEFDVVYSGNEWTLKCFKKHHSKVKKINLLTGISSTRIRNLIVINKAWKRLVPIEVVVYLKKIRGAKRIKDISTEKNKG